MTIAYGFHRYRCDACERTVEIQHPNLPKGWGNGLYPLGALTLDSVFHLCEICFPKAAAQSKQKINESCPAQAAAGISAPADDGHHNINIP
jgi:hypothetical protein